MATIKSYSNLEQSRKLAEILPLESADMHYNNASIKGINYVDEYRAELMDYNTAQKVLSKYLVNPMFGIIPCWSLAALLGVLPNKIISHETAFEGEDAEGINDIYHKCIKTTEDGRYTCCYVGNGCIYECVTDNPVDACVAMIIKLNELKML